LPGEIAVYEFGNHAAVDGKEDFLRLNVYLSLDHDFVTIWSGLLEPIFTEAALALAEADDFDFTTYNEGLFRGYFDSNEAAATILKALRVGESSRYARPQVLSRGEDNKLRCDWVPDVGAT